MLKKQDCNFKVSIIGTGYVGSSIAYAIMLKNLANEIVLIDKNQNTAIAEKLDLTCMVADICNCNIYAGNYSDIQNSDIIIVTCGRGRKPNETRLDMISDNLAIAENVANEIKKYYTKGIVLVISNPVDIITYKMINWLGFPNGKVFGTGCSLDSLRLTNVIYEYLRKESTLKIDAMIIGEHGDSLVPLWSNVKINNILIDDYCKCKNIEFNEEVKQKLINQVIAMGSNIIAGKGRTNYGIATCTSYIVDLIKNDKKQVISVSNLLHGEYGLNDLSLSLPCIVGKDGIEAICNRRISFIEKVLLQKSSSIIKNKLTYLKRSEVLY